MILETAVITGGVLYAGVRAYQQRNKPNLGQVLSRQQAYRVHSPPLDPLVLYHKARRNLSHHLPVLSQLHLGDTRSKHMTELATSTEQSEPSAEEREINTLLTVSSILLGTTTIGMLVYPPLLLLSTFPALYTFYPYIQSGYRGIVHERRVTTGVVDAICLTGMLLTGHVFTAVLFNTLLLLSRKLVVQTEDRSRRSLANVFGQQPRSVWVLMDDTEIEVPFEQLKPGDVVVVNAGEMIPVDGTIVEGMASIDQHMLTGEAQPVEKSVGDTVLASTMLLSGKVHIVVAHAGQDTAAARIGDILQRTADFKLSIQSRGEAVSDKAALPTLVLGTVTLPLLGINSALAVLFASIGYNMRLIAPLSVLNFLQIMADSGILIKDGRSLETLHHVDTIVFDKTGTLTLEQPHVHHIYTWNGYDEDALLTRAAAAEYRQIHPIARAILQAANERGLHVPRIEDARYEVGYGIKVRLENQVVRVGSDRFMQLEGIPVSSTIHDLQTHCNAAGHSLVLVAVDDHLAGGIELQPTIRPEARTIIDQLRDYGMELSIISGDQEQPTRSLAHELGIDRFFANTLPENKAKLIEQLQAEGRTVCFVGDGINDSIALKQANVSVSLRGATTIATDTAQIVLMDASLNQLAHLFELARNFEHNMQNNLITTIIPGAICLGGVFFLHFKLLTAVMLYNFGLVAGVGNAMYPIVRHHIHEKQTNDLESSEERNLTQ
jgi:Cu2+-exporting ATPase